MMEGKQADWRGEFKKLLSSLPKEYLEARKTATEISHAFHSELAAAIAPRLGEHLQTMKSDSYEEKRDLAAWCNEEVRLLRLSICCPRTGREAILVADVRGPEDDTSRFRLQTTDERGRRTRTYSAAELPPLELMEDPPRREGRARRARDDDKRQR
jgi:hypothetical protein